MTATRGNPRCPMFFENTGATDGASLALPFLQSLRSANLPVPPPELMEYGETVERHLESGKSDADNLRRSLLEAQFDPRHCGRFLDLGCSNGRILRWLVDWAAQAEGWGTDINSNTVLWCAQHLRPPFRFALNTTQPNLCFADGHFGLVYAFSIFTHIDDMFLSWLCEVARVLRPGGYFLVTILDEVSLEFLKLHPERPLAKLLPGCPHVEDYRSGRLGMFTIFRDEMCYAFYRRAFFLDFLADNFEVNSITERTMAGHQTSIIARRR